MHQAKEYMRVSIVALHTRCTKPVEYRVLANGAQSKHTNSNLLTKTSATTILLSYINTTQYLPPTGKPSLAQAGAPGEKRLISAKPTPSNI